MVTVETDEGPALRTMSVLLVEDQPAIAMMLARAWARIVPGPGPIGPSDLTVVPTVAAAVEALGHRQFDAVLSDLNLPDSNGLETLLTLRLAVPNVPIVVLTGIDDPAVAREALRAGAQDFLVKGVTNFDQLPRLLYHAIERHRAHVELADRARQLAESEARFRNVITASADGIVVIGPDGLVRLVNPAAEQLFGRPAGALVGSPFGFPLTGGTGPTTELDILRADGSAGVAGMRVTTVEWNGERGWLVALRDITDRVVAEVELKRALAQIRAVVAGAPIFLWALDRDGVITWSDGKLLTKLGLGATPIVGRRAGDVFGHLPSLLEATAAGLRGEIAHERIKSGDVVVEVWYTPLVPDDDGFVGTIGLGLDVTEEVRLEHAVRHAQRMEAVGRLAGGVAHDFNNLLTVIASFTELALQRVEHLPEVTADIRHIADAAGRATRLTSQLLAFSRRQVTQPTVLNINTEITRIGAILRRLIGEDIALQLRLPPRLAAVKIDPGQFEQVVMNLAVNARDAMPDGGRLRIETRNATVHPAEGPDEPRHYVRLDVTDTGVGMDEATRRAIFEPFFTTKEAGKGTGLGLATVYGVVVQNGGTIAVASVPGCGTTFTICLPAVNEVPTAGAEAAARAAPVGGSETILVVEDQPGVRATVAAALTRHGYRVLSAESGPAATELCRASRPPVDLLVVDVVMPGMNGSQVVRALTADHPDLRVLYMSGYTDDVAMRHGGLDGAAFIQKPFTARALCQRVRDVLDAGRPTHG